MYFQCGVTTDRVPAEVTICSRPSGVMPSRVALFALGYRAVERVGWWHTCYLGESGEHIHLRTKCLRGYPLGYYPRHTCAYYKGYLSASLSGTVLAHVGVQGLYRLREAWRCLQPSSSTGPLSLDRIMSVLCSSLALQGLHHLPHAPIELYHGTPLGRPVAQCYPSAGVGEAGYVYIVGGKVEEGLFLSFVA